MKTDFFEKMNTMSEKYGTPEYKGNATLEIYRIKLVVCKFLGIKPNPPPSSLSEKDLIDLYVLVDEDMKTLLEAYQAEFPDRDESRLKSYFESLLGNFSILNDEKNCSKEMLNYCKEKGLKSWYEKIKQGDLK